MLCHIEFCDIGPHYHGEQIYNEELQPPVQSWRRDYPQDACPQLLAEFYKPGASADVTHRCMKVYKRPWRRLFRKTFFWTCWRCGGWWQTTNTRF